MIGPTITPETLTQPRCLRGRPFVFFSKTTAFRSDAVLPILKRKARDEEYARTMLAIKEEKQWLGSLTPQK